ncbi:MAG: hypothetical protein V3S44_08495, partial [Alphaproteobacteria bacterium]
MTGLWWGIIKQSASRRSTTYLNHLFGKESGAAWVTRTPDPRITNSTLEALSLTANVRAYHGYLQDV